ncbi:apoptosis regulator R1-like [Sinocyclocheilus rhinocerous]|uniref:apoptosis regulator R1-like n=1 Tax=Sinocyclocheilus rhinocerous TaxID=307959 RepID=UPI0007B9514C|nr:PREDICTED: apoptosis regulator R1-like [Sinocyclocheilus rhinocerous]
METEKRESDYAFSKNLVLRSVKDQVQRAGICAPPLPEPQPMSDEQEKLLEQMAELIIGVSDFLDRNRKFNILIDAFVHVMDRQSFQRLAEKVFVDDITWAKIVTLICVVGKTVAKILANSVPSIVSWTLDYFQNNLQNWICSMGGWIMKAQHKGPA